MGKVVDFPKEFRDTSDLDRKALELNEAVGWVYILSNPVMPGILKIGFTKGDPSDRCEALSSATGVPVPFEIEDGLYCLEASRVEAVTHGLLKDCRINPRREYFKCSVRYAMTALWMADEQIDSEVRDLHSEALERGIQLFGQHSKRHRLAVVEGMDV